MCASCFLVSIVSRELLRLTAGPPNPRGMSGLPRGAGGLWKLIKLTPREAPVHWGGRCTRPPEGGRFGGRAPGASGRLGAQGAVTGTGRQGRGEKGCPSPLPKAGPNLDTIRCRRCGQQAPPLPRPPFRNDLGERILREICGTCWAQWLQHQTLLINHYGLDPRDPQAREFLYRQIEEVLFGGGPGEEIDTSRRGTIRH